MAIFITTWTPGKGTEERPTEKQAVSGQESGVRSEITKKKTLRTFFVYPPYFLLLTFHFFRQMPILASRTFTIAAAAVTLTASSVSRRVRFRTGSK